MNNTIKVLDHGYVRLHNISGAIPRHKSYEDQYDPEESEFNSRDIDPAIIARISFNDFKDRPLELDLKLVEYLMVHKHTSPFEMTQTWWEFKLPMFLGEQVLRHRTASINKVSGRYSTMPEEWYIPEVVGGKAVGGNKQGQEDNLSLHMQAQFKKDLDSMCRASYDAYTFWLKEGVAPEHARLFLHANQYTTMLWRIDLHNLMHFLALRLDSHAQVEARCYAQAIYDLLKQYLPKSMELFDKYKRM